MLQAAEVKSCVCWPSVAFCCSSSTGASVMEVLSISTTESPSAFSSSLCMDIKHIKDDPLTWECRFKSLCWCASEQSSSSITDPFIWHVSVCVWISYSDRFPLVTGFVSEAQLVFGSRVIQTAEGTGRLTEVSGNHQGAHCSTGGSTGQLRGEGDRDRRFHYKVSQR